MYKQAVNPKHFIFTATSALITQNYWNAKLDKKFVILNCVMIYYLFTISTTIFSWSVFLVSAEHNCTYLAIFCIQCSWNGLSQFITAIPVSSSLDLKGAQYHSALYLLISLPDGAAACGQTVLSLLAFPPLTESVGLPAADVFPSTWLRQCSEAAGGQQTCHRPRTYSQAFSNPTEVLCLQQLWLQCVCLLVCRTTQSHLD